MTSLFWPGDERAGAIFTDGALVEAMLTVESAWLATLVDAGIAPVDPDALAGAVTDADAGAVAAAAEAGGNPVIPFVALLRARVGGVAARWLHRGLTSQDVLDSALMLLARDARDRVGAELTGQVRSLAALADTHHGDAMVGRTLTQSAVPITFGAKVAGWLQGVLDAADDLAALSFPAQLGGAAGTLSGATALAGDQALDLAASAAAVLGLEVRSPWHTTRAPITRIGDALAGCTSAWGRIANDVLTLARPEIAELHEPTGDGRGGSSAMPQKANPILSVLVRRAALTSPALVSLLHLAAADTRDERPDGAWHVEWQPLQLLARHAVVAAAQTSELLDGLVVDTDRMASTLAGVRAEVDAEARGLLELAGRPSTSDVLGADHALVELALTRARGWLEAR